MASLSMRRRRKLSDGVPSRGALFPVAGLRLPTVAGFCGIAILGLCAVQLLSNWMSHQTGVDSSFSSSETASMSREEASALMKDELRLGFDPDKGTTAEDLFDEEHEEIDQLEKLEEEMQEEAEYENSLEEEVPVVVSPLSMSSFLPQAQMRPERARTFAYFKGACTSVCRSMKKAGFKQLPGLSVPAHPEFLLISYKSLTKYHNVQTSILNQVGYGSACIGGGKGKQLFCKEKFAAKYGCVYRTLGVQPSQWNIKYPETCREFMNEAEKSENAKQIWIVKPGGSFHGSGIKLYEGVTKLQSLYSCDRTLPDGLIVQRYLDKPALFSGYKFDFRTYLLIASMEPYVVFYHDGFVRRSEHLYDTSAEGLGDEKKHITNARSQSSENHFFSFDDLQQRLTEESGFAPDFIAKVFRPHAMRTTNFLFQTAREVFFSHRRKRFQIFALDWMLDANGGMHLLEANGNPSMTNYPGLDELTPALWVDMLEVVHLVQSDPESLQSPLSVEAGFRYHNWKLVYNELEAQKQQANFNPCEFQNYAKSHDRLFSFESEKHYKP